MPSVIFHLAFPARDIESTKAFYVRGLGCSLGRETKASLILELAGHQLVAHLTKEELLEPRSIYPRHFGLIFLEKAAWDSLLARAKAENLHFFETEKLRFAGSPTEHSTFFLQDPSHNLLEFKFYAHQEAIFGCLDRQEVGDSEAH